MVWWITTVWLTSNCWPTLHALEPVGSASSIVYRMFKEHGALCQKELAGLMLSGLISDALLFEISSYTPI